MNYTIPVNPQRPVLQHRVDEIDNNTDESVLKLTWIGYWNMSECGGYETRVPVNITSEAISFNYCNLNVYQYYLTPKNVIIQGGPRYGYRCQYARPPYESHIE